MKKKILIGVFLLTVIMTAIAFAVAAADSYHYDMNPSNGVDILEGFGAGILMTLGGLVILCELDIFFTVYYFIVKPKTRARSILRIVSQLMLLSVILSGHLADFLSRYVSDFFREELVVIVPLFFLYIVLRLICISFCFSKNVNQSANANCHVC